MAEELDGCADTIRDKRKELGSSLNTCQGYDIQMMLLIHRLSYGPTLTINTEERASVCQSESRSRNLLV